MNAAQKPVIRIFVSSPGDVGAERLAAERVLNRLRDQYASEAIIKPVFWEYEPLTATHHFQQKIPPPSTMDICICILWSRMGTPLPADEFKRADGTSYNSGTEYEFEDAFTAYQQQGRPDLLVYRKTAKPQFVGSSADEAEDFSRQLRSLEEFMDRWLHREGGLPGKAYSTFNQTREFEDKLAVHVSALIERRMHAAGRREAVWKQGSPFRGLQAFELEHAPVFFGREADTHRVIEQLKRQDGAHRAFVVVTGNSGSGKSSLVRAGVLPRLLRDPAVWPEVDLWRYAIIRPAVTGSSCPLNALCTALTTEAALPELASFEGLYDMIASNPASTAMLVQGALKQAAQKRVDEKQSTELPAIRLILVVDQFEESFSGEGFTEAERRAFFLALSALAQSGAAVVLATLRSDFYDRFCAVPELASLKDGDGLYDLQPPTKAEIGQMIRRPAYAAGLRFEEIRETGESLDEVLREDAAKNPESLPLLEFCLEQLYERAQLARSDLLTFEEYEKIGRIEGAIRLQAQAAFDEVSAEARSALSRVFRALVHVSADEGVPSRRRALSADVVGDSASMELVNAFIDARLLTAADGTVEVAHEALFTHWMPLKQWLLEEKKLLQSRSRVEASCARWLDARKPGDLLLPSGALLLEAEETLAAGLLDGSESESAREFVAKSVAADRRRRNVRRIAVAALIILALLTSATGIVASRLAGRNASLLDTTRKELYLSQMSLAADLLSRGNIARVNELLIRHIPSNGEADLRGFEWFGLWRSCHSDLETLDAHDSNINALAFSHDGDMFASCDDSGMLVIWDAASNKPICTIDIGDAPMGLGAMCFSSDSSSVMTAAGGAVRLWNPRTGKAQRQFSFEQYINDANVSGTVTDLALSADDSLIALRTRDGRLIVLNVQTGDRVAVLDRCDRGELAPIDFSATNNHLFFINKEGSIREWNADTKELETFATSPGWEAASIVTALNVSPDGTRLVAAIRSSESRVRMWDIEARKPVVDCEHPREIMITDMSFSIDGRWLIGGGSDKQLYIWDVVNGHLVTRMPGHTHWVVRVAASPDGQTIASASYDTTIKLWKLDELIRPDRFQGHDGDVLSVAFSHDGRLMASSGADGLVNIWDASSLNRFVTLADHQGAVNSVCFSPDNTLVASGGDDRRVLIWSLKDQSLTSELSGHRRGVNCVEMSPDGKLLASASSDSTVKIWDMTKSTCVATLYSVRGPIYCCAFSPDGRTLAVGNFDGRIDLFDLGTHRLLSGFGEDSDRLLRLAFSHDGELLATGGGGGMVRIWEVDTRELIHTCEGHTMEIGGLAFSSDGKTLVSGQWNGEIQLWNVATGRELYSLHPGGSLKATAFAPDGSTLVAGLRYGAADGKQNGFVRFWRATSAKSFQRRWGEITLLKQE